ncbi:hypothetical protein MBANPS3_001670 [Mucor bainieri]
MSDPSNNQQERSTLADQGGQELHLQVRDLQEDINRIRESNNELFRATAYELTILRRENLNLTSVLMALKDSFDSMVPNFIEQVDKVRELETWRINVENNHIPIHRGNIQDDAEDMEYDELIEEDQDENDRDEKLHTNDEEDDKQTQQVTSDNESNRPVATVPKVTTNEVHALAQDADVPVEIKPVKVEALSENKSAMYDPVCSNSSLNNIAKKEEPVKVDSKSEESMQIELAERDILVQGLTVENVSVKEESAQIQSMKTKSVTDDLYKEDAMEIDSTKQDSTVQCLAEKTDSTNKQPDSHTSKENAVGSSAIMKKLPVKGFAEKSGSVNSKTLDQESTDIKSAKKAVSETDLIEMDVKKKDTTKEAAPVQKDLTVTDSAEGESKTSGLMDVNLVQCDAVEEQEPNNKRTASKTDLTEIGIQNEEKSTEIKSIASADDKEATTQAEKLKADNKTKVKESADKEPSSNASAVFKSKTQQSIERSEEELTDPNLTQKDLKTRKPKQKAPEQATPAMEVLGTMSLDKEDPVKKDEIQRDLVKKDPTKKDPVKKRPTEKKSAKQESVKQEPAKQESAKQESAKQESAKQESVKREPAKQDSAKQDSAKQDSAKQDSAKQDSAKQESTKQESTKQESTKNINRDTSSPPPQASAANPVTTTTPIPKPKRKYKNPIVLIKSKKRKLGLLK